MDRITLTNSAKLIESKTARILSEKEIEFIKLIAKMIVAKTFRDANKYHIQV